MWGDELAIAKMQNYLNLRLVVFNTSSHLTPLVLIEPFECNAQTLFAILRQTDNHYDLYVTTEDVKLFTFDTLPPTVWSEMAKKYPDCSESRLPARLADQEADKFASNALSVE